MLTDKKKKRESNFFLLQIRMKGNENVEAVVKLELDGRGKKKGQINVTAERQSDSEE